MLEAGVTCSFELVVVHVDINFSFTLFSTHTTVSTRSIQLNTRVLLRYSTGTKSTSLHLSGLVT
jgi:hypothetical protein